jgi:uncharacterized membrane protein (UPF0127 family)
LTSVAAFLWVLAACGDDAAGTPTPGTSDCPPPPGAITETITFPEATGASLLVEIADTGAERATGLSNRDCVAANAGMLFAWPSDTTSGFWMKDTHVPLSIAFIRADGMIVSIQDMEPRTTDSHTSPEPYRYAIEVNQGWYAAHGVEVGNGVGIPESLSQNATN